MLRIFLFLLLWVSCAGIYGVRDVETRHNPNLYAEDAVWLDTLKHEQGWQKYFTMRQDYFVIGNLLLLDASALLNKIFFHNSLFNLPLSIAIMSWIYYGFLAALPLLLFRQFSISFLTAYGILFALMPMGADEPIILGRISTVGYSFAYLALLLILYLREKKEAVYIAQGGIVLCLLTNPTCFALLPLLARSWRKILPLICGAAFICGMLLARYWAMQKLGQHLNGPLQWQHMLEFALGRGFFYPLLSGVYSHLTDGTVVLCALGLCLAYWWARNYRHGYFIAAALAAYVVENILFLLSRPGLTGLLADYTNTAAGPYFITQHFIAFFILALVLYSISTKAWGRAIICVTLAVYLAGVAINLARPYQAYFAGNGSWQENVSRAIKNNQAIRVYPINSNWQNRFWFYHPDAGERKL